MAVSPYEVYNLTFDVALLFFLCYSLVMYAGYWLAMLNNCSINLVNQTVRGQENGTETVIPGTTKREMWGIIGEGTEIVMVVPRIGIMKGSDTKFIVSSFFHFLTLFPNFYMPLSGRFIVIVCHCFMAMNFWLSVSCIHNSCLLSSMIARDLELMTHSVSWLTHTMEVVLQITANVLILFCILMLYVLIIVVAFAGTEIMIMTEIGIIDTDHVLDQMRNIERDLDLVPALLPKGLKYDLFADDLFQSLKYSYCYALVVMCPLDLNENYMILLCRVQVFLDLTLFH